MRALAIALAAVVVLPVSANAQCAFDRPNGSSSTTAYLVSSLVRAFVSCNNPGGNPPNATTISGTIPSCFPAESFDDRAFSPPGGWEFRSTSSAGKVYVKRTTGGANANFDLPPTLRDAAITVKLYHIGNNNGGYASGTGSVMAILRVTTQDYSGDDMTVIDFPFGFAIPLSSYGSGSVTKKVGDLLTQGLSNPRFSDCTSIEIVSIAVHDPNGNIFAVPGVRY